MGETRKTWKTKHLDAVIPLWDSVVPKGEKIAISRASLPEKRCWNKLTLSLVLEILRIRRIIQKWNNLFHIDKLNQNRNANGPPFGMALV